MIFEILRWTLSLLVIGMMLYIVVGYLCYGLYRLKHIRFKESPEGFWYTALLKPVEWILLWPLAIKNWIADKWN